MLSDAELQALFEAWGTPAEGVARIRLMRKSLPARVARTNKLSAKTRYVPIKMPFVIEAEARETEYVALVEYDHDPEVLELYSQVEGLKISYLGPEGGRRITTPTTPDIFLIKKYGFVFVECKREEELVRLQRCSPNRYCRDATGRWRSPPAEAAAAELGCEFKVRSSADTNWTLHEIEEGVAAQRRADAEAASHRAKINAVPTPPPEQTPVSVSTSPADGCDRRGAGKGAQLALHAVVELQFFAAP